jgi:hypothetical protein
MAAARTTPQVRGWWPQFLRSRPALDPARGRGCSWPPAAIVGVGTSPAPRPAPAPSAPAVVAPPSGPGLDGRVHADAASTTESCPADAAQLTTGDAMPPTRSQPMTVLGDRARPRRLPHDGRHLVGPDRGGDPHRQHRRARLPTSPGSTMCPRMADRRSLSLAGPSPTGLLTCDNLYLLATDGSSAARISAFGAHEQASGARFSADGRFLAYRFDDLRGHTPVVSVVDLAGDPAPRIVDCGETSMFDFAWAPADDRLAMVCGGRLDVVSAESGTRSRRRPVLPVPWRDLHGAGVVGPGDERPRHGPRQRSRACPMPPSRSGRLPAGSCRTRSLSPRRSPSPVSDSASAPGGRSVAVLAFSRDRDPGLVRHRRDDRNGSERLG